MEAGEKAAVEAFGATEIFLEVQVQAQGFYGKLGYTVCSDELDDAGVLHVDMRASLV